MTASPIVSVDAISPRRGAAVLLEILHSEGVEFIFGNPGTTELPLMDALTDTPEIKYIWALQEASAVAMADGYAQAARKPGFLNLHTAGGLGHGMGNLLNASVSQTPLVVTAGQQDSRHTITDPLLFGDLVQIARPAVKWAMEVAHPDQLPVLVRRAFNDASAAPAGPVFLSLPMDVMEEMSTVGIAGVSRIDRRNVAGSLDELAARLVGVTPGKLLIIAGDEVYDSGAAAEVAALAETLGAPVYGSSWPARLPFPTSHPLWMGSLPNKGRAIHEILCGFDAVFALGGKSLITILYSVGPIIPAGCAVYQMSSDVKDLGRTYTTQLSVVGDIFASLRAMRPVLEAKAADRREVYAGLVETARAARDERRAALWAAADAQWEAAAVTPLVAAREISRGIGGQVHIVDEAVATTFHLRQFLHSDLVAQFSFSRGGALGWGMPAAVGFSLGLGRAPVVSLVGDGAAMYSPQALWTAAHEKLPVTFVVLNNREYNILKKFLRSQEHYLSHRRNEFIAMDLVDPAIDFLALAASMGVPAVRVSKAAEIAGAVAAGIASGLVNLVEVVIGVD